MDLKAHLGLQLVLGALTFVAVGLPAGGESARILAVLPMPAPSHHIAVSAVLKALADRGHDITFFSGLPKGNKINPTNVKTFHLDLPTETMAHDELKSFWEQSRNSFEQLLFLMDLGPFLCNVTLHNPVFKAEVNKPGQKYDLIIVETFFFQEAFVGLGLQFNVPVVTVNPFGTSPWVNEVMGNPVNPSWVPSPFLGFSDQMSFIERATNTLHLVMSHIAFNYYYIPKQDALLHEHWPDAPGIHYLLHSKLGLALVNNHFTLAYPAPVSPNVVEIGGIQIQEKVKPLPKDLQDYLDGAENGVVYFSMGSNLKLEHAPEDKRRAILDALGGLKEKVLLKWDGPDPKNISPNIRIIQWAPQADLLAHPKVRAFVTHGGLLSTQESVYHGVPVVGMPMFGDQPFNMRLAVRKGFGVLVEFKTLTKETLSAGLKEVLGNPKYKESATRLSRLFRAKQMRPVDASIWAVEHVLQHGADHLRPSSVGMPLYQLLLLDVILAAMAPLVVLVLCCRALCCRRGKSQQVSQADKRKKNK